METAVKSIENIYGNAGFYSDFEKELITHLLSTTKDGKFRGSEVRYARHEAMMDARNNGADVEADAYHGIQAST